MVSGDWVYLHLKLEGVKKMAGAGGVQGKGCGYFCVGMALEIDK